MLSPGEGAKSRRRAKTEVRAAWEVMMESLKMSRRDFNKSTVLGTATLALSAAPALRNVLGTIASGWG